MQPAKENSSYDYGSYINTFAVVYKRLLLCDLKFEV